MQALADENLPLPVPEDCGNVRFQLWLWHGL
jgi:hypothetical protein